MKKPENTLTGVWHGLYSYPRYLRPVYFVASLLSSGQSFSGTTHEAIAGRHGAPLTCFATISGLCSELNVEFHKTYDGTNGYKHGVDYGGTLDGEGNEIEGTWTIPGNWTGKFLMIRKPSMTEVRIRKVFERA